MIINSLNTNTKGFIVGLFIIMVSVVSCQKEPSKLKFNEVNKNFSVDKGKTWKGVFVFENTGGRELVINRTNANCGITVSYSPKTPVAPGKQDSIIVFFDGTSVDDKSVFNGSILLETNTEEVLHALYIKGFVK